jgi:UDP-4-amino-4,6-dideoxy-N-acetyl-beta-L-altrosamine transaminase
VIPYGRQDINQSDIDAVVDVLRSDFITQGPVVPRFEQAVASRVKARHAVAVNSGTSALHIACAGLRLDKGDALWTVPNTFVASANCARYCGAEVDFVDIDPDTWNMSVPQLQEKLVRAKKENRLPDVVVPVHFAGQPTEQEAIWELSEEFGFKVLEDASHAIGATRNDEPVGSCRWSHVTVFSFHPVKLITSGEGGMALTNDDEIAARMTMFRSHGITRDPTLLRGDVQSSESTVKSEDRFPAWYYEQQMLGFNYRMTDIHAALGLNQLARLEEFVERRNILARRYDAALEELPLRLPGLQSENRSAFHLYVVRLERGTTAATHRQVFDELRQLGIGVNVHYIPVHLQPYYRDLGFAPNQYPEAEAYGMDAITLPLYPTLTDKDQDTVIDCLVSVLRE